MTYPSTNTITHHHPPQAIHPFAAAALLRHCSWNKEMVIDSFCTDPDRAKDSAGISRFVLEFKQGTENRVCGICRDEVQASTLIAIGCNHLFCRSCFTAYLVSKVRRRKRTLSTFFVPRMDISNNPSFPSPLRVRIQHNRSKRELAAL